MNQIHPRPQLKREHWISLDGQWKLNDSTAIVPFPPQSVLSGYTGLEYERLVYTREFSIPSDFIHPRTILHFGAVDQICAVFINNKLVGQHEGGYLPFSFDITKFIQDGTNTITVKCVDTLSTLYPYGKQSKKPGGMWYTPVSGIWKSVWLENVPENFITGLKITPDLTGAAVILEGEIDEFQAIIETENGHLTFNFSGNTGRIEFENPILWDTDNPHIYNMTITSGEDSISTYFALRQISINNICGINRVCLNDKPIFLHGVLDQGYFYDGIFTPKDMAEYEKDIFRMKELGFNTLRKHIKIEPDIFYYYCDIHGMLVIQDMVNSGDYSFIRDTVLPTIGFKKRRDWKMGNATEEKRREFFTGHMLDTINHLYNHPSVVVYTIFNEGWGQFESDMMYQLANRADPTRLYNSTSGWFAQMESDFDSEHVYFRTKKLKPGTRPMLLSECGGFTYKVPLHCYKPDKTYGYGTCKSSETLTDRICDMYEKMVLPAIPKGLCGCIYTQLSDIEEELNGFYTYDREICKVEKNKIQHLAKLIASAIMF